MLFNVATLLREPTGNSRRYVLQPEEPIHRGEVELVRMPDGVLVRAWARVLLDAACSRCLAPFAYPAEVDFEEVYFLQVDPQSGRHYPPPEDPESFLISLQNTVDITEAVRQYSEMAAAIQPLCRADCPGLCPVCGADLSITACDCEREPADPRWASLAALKRSYG